MLSMLPDFADPLRLCALGKAYSGSLPLAELQRLTPLLASLEGEAAFTLGFGRDEAGWSTVDVTVQAELVVQCQRCLGRLRVPVDAHSRLAIVGGPDEAARLPDSLDPLLVEDGSLALRSLVEDELILAIPPAPTHPPEDCDISLDNVNRAQPEHEQPVGPDGDNPFAVLADWKPGTDPEDRQN